VLRGLVTAIRTLTILPVPGSDTDRMVNALTWFPLVGFMVGIALYGLARAFDLVPGGWAAGAAVTVVVGAVFLTGGFHFDGLGDWADGFGGGRNKAHTLAIMKDTHMGAFGVLAIILVVLVKYAALARLVDMGALHLILPAFIVSRVTMVELAVSLPYARSEGGTADPFVNGARLSHRFGALIVSIILLIAFSGIPGLILLAVGLVACRLLGIWSRHRVGGVTGDVLGACSELVETGLLFSSAMTGHWLMQLTGGRLFSL